jgi:ribosomal subunit interface protein
MKYDITTRNFTADAKIRDYVQAKVGHVEKFLPRQVRSIARAEILLEEDKNGREDNRFVCEVIMTLPGAKLVCREGTVNMYAAIDIVDAKLRAQARTYKDKATTQPRRMRMLGRLWGRKTEIIETEPATSEPSL